MSRTVRIGSWIRHNRFAAGTLLCLAVGTALLWQSLHQNVLPAAVVDRLRMAAASGRDPAALPRLLHAAQQGNLEAQRAAGSVLVTSKDVQQLAAGIALARLAAGRGDAGAQYLLAKILFDGNAAQVQDRQQARIWFEQAARQQHAQAAYFLGLIYKNGYGVAIDAVKASNWFVQSVALGNADAMFMLGNAYLAGDGVALDQTRAVALLQQAAEQEHPLAAQMLAYALRDGTLGLQRDRRAAQEMVIEVDHALHHPRPVF